MRNAINLLRTDVRVISERLKAERESLGLSQQALADRVGVSLRSQQNYESGDRIPDATYLGAMAAIGADVLYILTGQRTGDASAPGLTRAVSEGDRILLDNFHAAPAGVQAGVKTTLDSFAPAEPQVKGRKRAA